MGHALKTVWVIVFCTLSFCVQAEGGLRKFEDIIESGQLRIGVALYTPWTMRSKNGDLIGSEIDIAYRLAADMGVTAKLGVYEWERRGSKAVSDASTHRLKKASMQRRRCTEFHHKTLQVLLWTLCNLQF